jgi:transposase-like protein
VERERNRITLMEEIVHKYRNHVPTDCAKSRQVFAREPTTTPRRPKHTVSALPWATFYQMLNKGMPVAEIAEAYDVSIQLVEYRIKITGASNLNRNRCGES